MLYLKLLSFGLIISTISCSPTNGDDCGFEQNVYGRSISWKRLPIPIYINSTVPEQLKPAIYRAASTWEKNAGIKIFNIIEELGNHTQSSKAHSPDRKNSIYFLTDWPLDRKFEQGRTSTYWAGEEIKEADIRINAADFGYYDQDPQNIVRIIKSSISSDGYNFEALMLHELGHFLGLKHRETDNTVMSQYLVAYSDRINLSLTDVYSVRCEYN